MENRVEETNPENNVHPNIGSEDAHSQVRNEGFINQTYDKNNDTARTSSNENSNDNSRVEDSFTGNGNLQQFIITENTATLDDYHVFEDTATHVPEDTTIHESEEEKKSSPESQGLYEASPKIYARAISETLDAISYDAVILELDQQDLLLRVPHKNVIVSAKKIKQAIYDLKFERLLKSKLSTSPGISEETYEVLLDERFYSGTAKIFQLLTSRPKLKNLELYFCVLLREQDGTNPDLTTKIDLQFPNIESLTLRSSQVDQKSFEVLLQSLPKLKKIAIKGYQGRNLLELLSVLEKVAPALELEEFTVSGTISLYDFAVGEEGQLLGYEQRLRGLLSAQQQLKKLDLSENKLSSGFIEFIENKFGSNGSLGSLSLADCLLGSAKLKLLMQNKLSTIIKLSLAGNNFEELSEETLNSFLSNIPNLAKLNLSRCYLNLKQAGWMFSKSHNNLEEINLSDNNLGDQVFKLLKHLSLKRLALQNCNLTFAGQITVQSSLEYLDVSNQGGFRDKEIISRATDAIRKLVSDSPKLTVVCYGIEIPTLESQDSNLQETSTIAITNDSEELEAATNNQGTSLSDRILSGEVSWKASKNTDRVENEFKQFFDSKFDEKHLYREAKKRQMRKAASPNHKVFSDLVLVELLTGTTTGFPKERIVYQGTLVQQFRLIDTSFVLPTSKDALQKIGDLLKANNIPFRHKKGKSEEEISLVFLRIPQNQKQNLISVPLKIIANYSHESTKIIFVLHKEARKGQLDDQIRRNRAIADVAGYLNAELSKIAKLSSFNFEIEKNEIDPSVYSVRLRCSRFVSDGVKNLAHWALFSIDIGMIIIGCLQEEYLTERRVIDDIELISKALSRKMEALVGEYEKSFLVEELCK